MATTNSAEPTRRDFLYIATAATGAVGAGFAAWPFIHQMNPDASALALSTTEVDIAAIQPGQIVTVKFRGKAMFVRRRTKAEIEAARKDDTAALPHPAKDADRVKPGKEEWLIVSGVCTHLGCTPVGTAGGRGEYDGWFCPCHGSHYDTSGRIRKGPAPLNLPVPEYQFTSPTVVLITDLKNA